MKQGGGYEEQNKRSLFLEALVPFLLFFLVTEAAGGLITVLGQELLGSGDLALFAFITQHAQTAEALSSAISIAAGFAFVFRGAAKDISGFREECRREEEEDSERRRRTCALKKLPGGSWGALLLLLFASCFLALGLNILLSLTGLSSLANGADRAAAPSSDPWYPLLALLVYGILSPYIEESVFRGSVYVRLRRAFAESKAVPGRRAVRGAALLTAILFAFYHGNLPQGIYAFLMGLVFAFAAELSGDVKIAIYLHAAANICVLIISLLSLYNDLCTPVWCACFLALGAAALGTLILFLLSGNSRDASKKK